MALSPLGAEPSRWPKGAHQPGRGGFTRGDSILPGTVSWPSRRNDRSNGSTRVRRDSGVQGGALAKAGWDSPKRGAGYVLPERAGTDSCADGIACGGGGHHAAPGGEARAEEAGSVGATYENA